MTDTPNPAGADAAKEDAELSFLQRQEVHRQILDAIVDMVLVKGKNSRILWANRAFRDYYGMSNEQLRDLVDAPFNSVDYTQQYVLDDTAVFTSGRTLEIVEEPVTRHDGLVQLFNTVKSAIRDDDGNVRMTVGVSRNITETTRLREDSLRYREQLERDRLAGFAAQLPGFLFQYRVRADGTEHVPFVSARVHDYYGVSVESLADSAERFFCRVEPEDAQQLAGLFKAAASELSSVHSLHRATGADGRLRWMEMSAQPSSQADGSVLFNGYVHDVSERRAVELERERLIAELRQQNVEREQFTFAVSHDLKSPLVTIRSYLGVIEKDIQQGVHTRVLADLGRVRFAAEKMSRMLDDLLELSRVGRVKHNPVQLAVTEVVHEACALLAGRLRERGVEVVVNTGGARVLADPHRTLQVFQNIIENAVKYMGDQPAPRIEVASYEERGFVVCTVRDNGIGIAPTHSGRIFGLFEKVDAKSEGTGVGLALVRSIVDAHGGDVWVESAGQGKGSTFYVRLPAPRSSGDETDPFRAGAT